MQENIYFGQLYIILALTEIKAYHKIEMSIRCFRSLNIHQSKFNFYIVVKTVSKKNVFISA